jgi:hypothetical protein
MTRHALTIFIVSIALCLCALAQTKPEPPPVDVELVVKGPETELLVNKKVVVTIAEQTNPPRPELIATTDAHGVARFQLPAGFFRLGVKVPGVGYGNAGATEFIPGVVAHPVLPPLAGYSSIDGVIPREVCTGEVTIGISSPYIGQLKTDADASGHFHFDDVPGGEWFVAASRTKDMSCLCALGPTVSVNVGKSLQNVKAIPLNSNPCWTTPSATPTAAPSTTSEPKPSAPIKFGHPIKTDTPIVWARGTVKEESGQPIENATVYVLGTYYGGIRMMEVLAKAKTDSKGYYELKGASGLSNFSATLLAAAPGHPPAWAWPAFPQISWFDSDPPVPEAVTQDLVLPAKSGELTVTALYQGKPAAGVSVAVYLENANLRDVWALAGRGGVRDEIENAAYPAGKTDANGKVRFDNLLPGLYRIYAIKSDTMERVRGLATYPQATKDVPSATASGIPVRIGGTTLHAIEMYELPTEVSFRVLHPDGSALEGNTPIQAGTGNQIQWSSSISLDSTGLGHRDMGSGGLWQIHFIHKVTTSAGGFRSPDDFREPFDLASALLAVSPSLSNDSTPVFRGRPVQPPSAHIVVQDAKGAPVRATVTIIQLPMESVFGAGGTDKDGEIVFSGLLTGQEYVVRVSGTALANSKPVSWGDNDEPLPSPSQLSTQYVFTDQNFVAAAESPNKVVVQPQPLGYVYGKFRSTRAKELLLTRIDRQQHGLQAALRLRPSTGEFAAGPFLPGPVRIYLKIGEQGREFPVPIEVHAGSNEPTRFDIDIDTHAPDADGGTQITGAPNSFLGMSGISTQTTGAQHLVGKVFLSDGVTPAVGAQVMYFQAGGSYPAIFAMTDALGELRPRGLWSGPAVASGSVAQVQSPVVVALLPGERGATIYTGPVHANKELRLVLPPAISVGGAVTVGGRNPSQRPGVIHVLAAYQERGVLNSALSVETTADAQGQFLLAGLTPGTYLVQAVLDDIWLSSVATLRVSAGNIDSIHLAIPAPGTPVHLELFGASGKPLASQSITLERDGPLAYLWPVHLTTDGSGSLYIPTLEAGRHTIRISGATKNLTFVVPALPDPPIVVRLRTAL